MPSSSALSRRAFGRLIGKSMAATALPPLFAAGEAGARAPAAAGGVVRLSANENPYGPSPAALRAMREAFSLAWRYPDEAGEALVSDLVNLHGLPKEWFLVGDGSSEILKLAASAFTGPGRKLVMADPTFEAIGVHARVHGAEIVAVPLDAQYAHDLEKMALDGPGLVYLCNPNNPTGSITPKARVRAFLDAVPSAATVLVDEAYHHYAGGPDYESVAPLVAKRANLVVARTFSKIHGMAGLRLGYAIAQPAAIEKLAAHAAWDSANIIALAAGRASLNDTAYVAEGRRRNAATKDQVIADLRRLGFEVVPSQTNFVLIDTRKEVNGTIEALRARGVLVGRLFPALPRHLRVTIGTPAQMKRFLDAFAAVVA
ncbi:MAG: histidinol-phosphate transaminase [Myxococcales bacterium]